MPTDATQLSISLCLVGIMLCCIFNIVRFALLSDFEDLSLVPRSADLTEFGSLTVSINIDANPTPNVTLNRMSGRVMIIGNSILFQSVDRADGGRYVVTADNGVDVKTAEFTLTGKFYL